MTATPTTSSNKSNIYCLYHAGCLDGTGAKYAMWSVLKDKANYIPVQYGEDPPAELNSESEVYILDFSYSREVLEGLITRCKKVVILDHHKTAKDALEGIQGCECVFDMTKSGAMLAWEHFHPNTVPPTLLRHVQDRDLWSWKMPGTKTITAALHLMEGNMRHWESVAKNDEGAEWTLERLVDSGITILEVNNLKIKSALKKVKLLPFFGYNAGVINYTELTSEIGEAIYNSPDLKADIAIVYCITNDNEVLLSLRSKTGNNVDVSAIAKRLGGGGHPAAAGCKIPLALLPSLLLGKM